MDNGQVHDEAHPEKGQPKISKYHCAPLLATEVYCTLLDICELDGDDWSPAYDQGGTLIRLLVTEGARKLSERLIHPAGPGYVPAPAGEAKDWNLWPSRRGTSSATPALQMMGVCQQQACDAMHAHARAKHR